MTLPAVTGSSAPVASIQITKRMLQTLAPLPATAVRMLAMLQDPNASPRRIAEAASQDVGISAAILRMANSPVLGMRGRVGSIGEALTLIGTEQARLIVLSCGVAQAGRKELRLYGLQAGAFQRHSELVATLTMGIARQRKYAADGVAYSTGLLHDIGKVILNGMALQEGLEDPKYERFSLALRGPEPDVPFLERACFGADHLSAGRDAAVHWALPPEIDEAIVRHHDPMDGSEQGLPAFLYLANAVAGAADPMYPRSRRAPLPEQPVVPIEPLIAMAVELVRGKR